MKHLTIIFHSQGGGTKTLITALMEGIKLHSFPELAVHIEDSVVVKSETILEADAIVLGTAENFGYMSGAMKHFFDRIYYPCLETKRGLPYQLIVNADTDGRGAVNSVENIIRGLGWKRIDKPQIFKGKIKKSDLSICKELGATIAAGLEAGIF
jgi:multimeric flavodoxin WrbA